MIRKKVEPEHLVIDLTGPQGNAFFLLGVAETLAKRQQLDSAKILEEMKSGDYENLVQVFENYFGHFVILER